MSEDLTKWRIFCNTENLWSEGWQATSAESPTKCFNNSAHSVNTSSLQAIDNTQTLVVKIAQEVIKTGGNFKSQGHSFTAAPNTVSIYPVSWPYPMTAIVVHIQTDATQIGDTFCAVVGPETIVGVITSTYEAGVTTVSVNSTVLAHAYIGYECFIGSEFLGRILTIDLHVFTITFETPTTVTHVANSYFKMQMRIIDCHNLGMTNGNDIGESNIGGKYLPANMVTNVYYYNMSNDSKICKFSIEYLY